MKTTAGKIFGKIVNRMTITGFLILIQLVWFGIALMALTEYSTWVSLGFSVASILMALFITWRDDNPAYKTAWILLICLLPVLGAAMYAFFGNRANVCIHTCVSEKLPVLHKGHV